MNVRVDPDFDPVPSLSHNVAVSIRLAAAEAEAEAEATGVLVTVEDDKLVNLPTGYDASALAQAGFTGRKGQTYLSALTAVTVLVGTGSGIHTTADVRDAIAAFARTAAKATSLTIDLTPIISNSGAQFTVGEAAEAATEGALLARYSYNPLKSEPKTVQLTDLIFTVDSEYQSRVSEIEAGITRGVIMARTANLARDLSNTPPRHLTAEAFANVIKRIAPSFGLEAEVFDRQQLIELGCGGLLGVNAGSVDEPRMVKLRYSPKSASAQTPHLALVGKGIMYDSGGISLKPSNAMHATMKLDMSGAAAVFSAMTSLAELEADTQVTGWLMCTDNMPSGSATKLGDVLTIRGGKTVEVKNTDAEGRLVLADGLVLATEEEHTPDAIVDIATLTGAALMALGTRSAALIANNDALAKQLEQAAHTTDETVWRLPLDHRYRDQLKSDIADLSNIGGQYAGSILAALFLNEFVADIAWGHLDIAPTMMSESNDLWRSIGATGFGARLLSQFAQHFDVPENTTT